MMEEFGRYFSSCGLAMNPEKSELVLFRGRWLPSSRLVSVGDQVESDSMKLLGLTVQTGYRFDRHAKNVAASCNMKTSRIGKIIGSLDKKTAKTVTESIIISTATYLLEIYGPRLSVQSKVQKSLNNSLRMLSGGNKRTHVDDMLRSEGWLSMTNLYRLQLIMSMRRVISTRNPFLIFYHLFGVGKSQVYTLRNRGLELQWNPLLESARSCFLYAATQEMNLLHISQQLWPTDDPREIRDMIKSQVINHHGNYNC